MAISGAQPPSIPPLIGGSNVGTCTNSTGDTFVEAICTRISVYVPIYALYSAISLPTKVSFSGGLPPAPY